MRIAEGEHPNDIRESDYFTERGEFRVDSEGSPTLLNCLMYKLSYYRSAINRLIKCAATLQTALQHYTLKAFYMDVFVVQIWRA